MILLISIYLSSISFFIYFISYFISPFMENEFKRLNLEKIGLPIITLELLASLGLLIGIKYNPMLLLSSGGLSLMMLCAILFRMKSKDSFQSKLPAIFYMLLNLYIFIKCIN